MKEAEDLKEKFGKLIFLEGERDAFSEYNSTNKILANIYDRKGWDHDTYDRLYHKSKHQLILIFSEILSNKERVTLVSHTTGIKKVRLKALFNVARAVFDIYAADGSWDNPIAYFIEQDDKAHFRNIAHHLEISHISSDNLLEED